MTPSSLLVTVNRQRRCACSERSLIMSQNKTENLFVQRVNKQYPKKNFVRISLRVKRHFYFASLSHESNLP